MLDLERLREIVAQFDELTEKLCDPDLLGDPARYKAAAQQRAGLESMANQCRRYVEVADQFEETRAELDKANQPADMLAMFGAAQQGDLARVSELQIKLWIDGGFRQAAQVDAQVRADAARMNRIAVERGTFFIADAQPLNPLDPPAAQRLGEVKAPVLVIDGGLDHPELLRAADVLVANIRGARKLVIENAAHTPNMERPDVFNRAVLDFLQADGV